MANLTAINPWTWSDEFGFVQAVESRGVTRILHCAGQGSLDEHGRILHVGDMAAQVREALNNVETVLRAAGLSLANVTRLNSYTTDMDAFNAVQGAEVAARVRDAGCRASGVLIGVTRLALADMLIEIEATAVA